MGIKDLLPSLADVMQKDFPLADLKGKRVAVDASAWLHKAIFATAEESMDLNFEEHLLYVDFLITRTRNFRLCGVEPVLVFDGKRNSLKADTNAKRSEERQTNLEQARRLMVSMNKTSDPACKAKLRSEAVASFQRGLTVTPDVEKHAIAAMRRLGVTVIVAPYEADSQLAYLCAIGMCEAVLTEDSDIIVYSAICKTNFPILYKFSTNGIAQMIECSRVFKPHRSPLNPDGTESTGRRSKFLASLRDYLGPSGRRMFVQMCVLAGCDYNESVPGVGLQYAQQAVAKFKDVPDDERLQCIVEYWQSSGKRVPSGFLERAKRAESLFFYHLVYDPRTKKIVHFTPAHLEGGVDSLSPLVSPGALAALGSDSELLRPSVNHRPPAGTSVADICEGLMARVDFSPIYPILPWEYPELASLVDRVPRASAKAAAWSLRRNLMGILKDHLQTKSPPNKHIPPLKRSLSWNNSCNKSNIDSACTTSSAVAPDPQPFGDRPVIAVSLTSTTATLSPLPRPAPKVRSPPGSRTTPPSAGPRNVPYSPQPQARRHTTPRGDTGGRGEGSTGACANSDRVPASTNVTVATTKTTVDLVTPSPVKRTALVERSPYEEEVVTVIVESSTTNIDISTGESSTAVEVSAAKQELIVCTPQPLRAEPAAAVKATPQEGSICPAMTEDTWPGLQINSNSQHSISPVDKVAVAELNASEVSCKLLDSSENDIAGGKRKRPDGPPSRPNFPSIVRIDVGPRGAKRKKTGATKTMTVASITSFFSVTTAVK